MVGQNGHSTNGKGRDLERRDMRNLERCLTDPRWVMPEELRNELPARLALKAMGISEEGQPPPSERHSTMAARILVQMMGQNQADEHMERKLDEGNDGTLEIRIVRE